MVGNGWIRSGHGYRGTSERVREGRMRCRACEKDYSVFGFGSSEDVDVSYGVRCRYMGGLGQVFGLGGGKMARGCVVSSPPNSKI